MIDTQDLKEIFSPTFRYQIRVAGVTSAGEGPYSDVILGYTIEGGLQEPESGPFLESIGFIVLIAALLAVAIVIVVMVILVVKRKAVKKKKARNYRGE